MERSHPVSPLLRLRGLRRRGGLAAILAAGVAGAAGGCAGSAEDPADDPGTGAAPRAVVRSGLLTAPSDRPTAEIASDHVASLRSSRYGDLELVGERSRVVRFAQRHRGLRVVGGGASVRVDERGRVRWTRSRMVPLPPDFAVRPETEPPADDPELVVFAPTWAPPRLAWQRDGAFDGASAPRTYIDAATGRPLHVEDRVLYERQAWAYDSNPIVSDLEQVTLDHLPPGSGLLRDGDLEVMTCVDGGECAELSADGAPGLFAQRCSPEHLAIADESGDFLAYEEPDDDRAVDDPFAEVQVYHHLSRALDWFRSLGLEDLRTRPIMVLTNYRPEGAVCDGAVADQALRPYYDNAFYSPAGAVWQPGSRDMLAFGNGRRADLGWDGDVAYHELTHAVMHSVGELGRAVKDELGIDHTPGGMHEGFADYFAAAFAGDPELAEWYGWHRSFGAPLRDLTIETRCYEAAGGDIPEPHAVGQTLAAALWRIRSELAEADRPRMDRAMFRIITAFDEFDNFATAYDLIIAELEAELGDAAAAAARATLDERRIGDCTRILPLQHDGKTPWAQVIGFPAEAGRPTPTTLQWQLEVFEAAPELRIEVLSQCEAATALLKPGAEPIQWDWSGPEGQHDAPMTTELREEPRWHKQWAVFPGPVEAGVYHLQLLNHGSLACYLFPLWVEDDYEDSGSDGVCDLERPQEDLDCYDTFCAEEGVDVDCDGVCYDGIFDLDCQDGECDEDGPEEDDPDCVSLPSDTGDSAATPIALETIALRHLEAVSDSGDRQLLSRQGNVVRFAQTHRGVPVVGGGAAVRIDDDGRVGWWRERVAEVPDGLATEPALTAEQATSRARDLAGASQSVEASPELPELIVFAPPGVPARLAWRVDFPAVASADRVAAPSVMVDATTGDVLDVTDAVRADRRARVYDPDPLAPLAEVTLESLPPGADVLRDPDLDLRTCVDDLTCTELEAPNGPAWLHLCSLDQLAVADAAGDFLFDPPASGLANDDPFTEVQLYHQLSAGLRWFRSIGFGALLHQPILAVANYRQETNLCSGEDAATTMPVDYPFSFFSPAGLAGHPGSEHALVFGTRWNEGAGGPLADWAWDSDIVHHELGHAVLHTVGQPGVLVRDELGVDLTPGAVQEGLADYFAAAMTGDPRIGEWSAAFDRGPGTTTRDLDNDLHCYAPLRPEPGSYYNPAIGERHTAGPILGGALWDIRESLAEPDRPRLDAAVLEVAAAIDPFTGFAELGQLLTEELELAFGAEVAAAAAAIFDERGIFECQRLLPVARTAGADVSTNVAAAPPGGLMPSTIQWTFEVTEEVPRVTFEWRNDCGPDSEVYLKRGGEPIQWTWDDTTGTNDAECFAPQPDGQYITLPGPFPPGTYVMQIGNRGPTECLTAPFSVSYSTEPPPAPQNGRCEIGDPAIDADCYDGFCSGTDGDPDCDDRCVIPGIDIECQPDDPGEEVPGVTGGPCPPPDDGSDGEDDGEAGDDGVDQPAEGGDQGGCGCGAAAREGTGSSVAALFCALAALALLRRRRARVS